MIINDDIIGETCPGCGLDKNWEHVLLCEKARRIRDDFCTEIKEKCKKVEMHNKNVEEAHAMIDDIRGHCNNALVGQTR